MSQPITKLPKGVYELPGDCKAFVRGGKVYVCKKYANETKKCRECIHFGTGRTQYNGNPFMSVCFAKPKINKSTGYKKEIREQQRYYAAHPYKTACDKFKPHDNGTELL